MVPIKVYVALLMPYIVGAGMLIWLFFLKEGHKRFMDEYENNPDGFPALIRREREFLNKWVWANEGFDAKGE